MSHIAILGCGQTGLACIDFLAPRTDQLTVFDLKKKPPAISSEKNKLIFKQTDFLDPNSLITFDRIIISPGIPTQLPAIQAAQDAGIPLESEIELFAQAVQAPVVAITGSNGKSTVTTWLGEMARADGVRVGVGGNLGPPALRLLSDEIELYILELSSFQLETTYSLQPIAACVLNISADHLDRYADFKAYAQAKLRIFQGARQVVLNRADPVLQNDSAQAVTFGLDRPQKQHYGVIQKGEQAYLAYGDEILCPASDLKVLGQHNIENALATLALAQASGLNRSACLSALKTYAGLPHRCEVVAKQDQILWINDSKGTNVGATLAALQGLAGSISGRWILIAGGRSKQADLLALKSLILKTCRLVILLGEAASEIKTILGEAISSTVVASLKAAVSLAHQEAKPGEGVLLSPACASFDQFKNFEARGDQFRALVQNILCHEI